MTTPPTTTSSKLHLMVLLALLLLLVGPTLPLVCGEKTAGGGARTVVQDESGRRRLRRSPTTAAQRSRRRKLVSELFPTESGDELVRVFVGYNTPKGKHKLVQYAAAANAINITSTASLTASSHFAETVVSTATAAITTAGNKIKYFDKIGVVAVALTKSQLLELEREDLENNDIEYIEKDEIVTAYYAAPRLRRKRTRRQRRSRLLRSLEEQQQTQQQLEQAADNNKKYSPEYQYALGLTEALLEPAQEHQDSTTTTTTTTSTLEASPIYEMPANVTADASDTIATGADDGYGGGDGPGTTASTTTATTTGTIPMTGNCSSSKSFKIGIVDSGIFAGHPNLPCSGRSDATCIGKSFGTDDKWYKDRFGHGTSGLFGSAFFDVFLGLACA